MDQKTHKKCVNGLAVSRNESKLIGDRSSLFCNRIGCNGRLKSASKAQTISLTNLKTPKSSDCCSSNTKTMLGSSSSTSVSVARPSAENSPPRKIMNTKKVLDPHLSRPKSSRFLFSEVGTSSSSAITKVPQSKFRLGELESVSSRTAIQEKKKSCEGESSSGSSSSFRGKKMIGTAPILDQRRIMDRGISISESSTRNYSNGSGRGRSEGQNSGVKPTISPLTNATAPSSSRNVDGQLQHQHQQRYNVHDIAELLLAFERAEHRGDITYEQLRILEANLFRQGLASHDLHSDMRLDIDDMSYEELLDLEERMGTVSTALSEEELSRCIRTSVYHGQFSSSSLKPGMIDDDDDKDGEVVKCSICQEGYRIGDVVGTLSGCAHAYHHPCVRQWLQLKNWCPICKSPANSSF